MLQELLGDGPDSLDGELEDLRTRRADIERRMCDILDNTTGTNREFADRRIGEPKGELKQMVSRLDELEAA